MTALAPLADRVHTLEATFREVGALRMAGVPVQNPQLTVQAVGFAPLADGEEAAALGVLVTPWFMNLVRLPLTTEVQAAVPAVGRKRHHAIAGQDFEFIGAHEPAIGPFETCSLFSPMFEFVDQAAALATAHEVLALLRPTLATESAPVPVPVPARRGFLFGRSAVAPR